VKRAFDRLCELPPLFSSGDVARLFGWTGTHADVRIKQWRDQALIQSFGRSGLHFNCVVDPGAPVRYGDEALRRLMPSAIVGHLTVLHDAGWTTQVPRDRHVYVASRRSYPKLPGYQLHGRPRRWLDRARSHFDEEPGGRGLRRVTPAFALADVIARGELAGLDPDDFEADVAGEQALAVPAIYRSITRKPMPEEWGEWICEAGEEAETDAGPGSAPA